MKSYLPIKEESLRAWFLNFMNLIDQYAAQLGLSPEVVAALKSYAQSAMDAIDDVLAKRSAYAASVAAKNSAIGASESFYRNEVTIIKKLPGYDDSVGQALGIIPPVTPFDPTTYQAKITKAVNSAPGGEVTIRFSKANGNINGVRMYRRINGQGDFVDLGFRMLTPFVDDTPLAQPGVPELREYRCCGVIDDANIGLMSEIVQLAVS